ncbi:hypothetical protein DSM107133_00937 [Pseudosulfitobacter sp. DSM 107133]|nr:hypothetical protein DSM107133_00937 [Pseudosulfitobacter sp. DSM 107133]
MAVLVSMALTAIAANFVLNDQQKQAIKHQALILKNKAADLAVSVGLSTCQIKGNVSYNSGERIYHMPGQEDYHRTRINWVEGERWFCTEADARAAGWRRARN